MAGIQRFITYIYSYEDGKKGSNYGFAKIENRGREYRLEIHLKKMYMKFGEKDVFLIKEANGTLLAFYMGAMKVINGNGDYGTIIKAENISGSEYHFKDMDGLLVKGGDEQMFLSRWNDGEMAGAVAAQIKRWEPPRFDREEKAETGQNTGRNMAQNRNRDIHAGNEGKKSNQSVLKEKNQETKNNMEEAEELQATEMPMKNIFVQQSLSEACEKLKEHQSVFTLQSGEKEALCIRIELKNLRELPKKYWYMGNNSFLLHGFFNYRYLILGTVEEGSWFLGVPGIYQQQERVMASIFGFPEFMQASTKMDEKQEEPVNQFGYWCHQMD